MFIIFIHFGIKFDRKLEDIKIYTGSNRLRADGTLYNVQKFIIHEKFDKPDHKNDRGFRPHMVNDIGLIRVKETIEFNNKTQPIKLSKSFIEEGTDLKMTGWGSNIVKPLNTFDYFSNEKRVLKIDLLFTGFFTHSKSAIVVHDCNVENRMLSLYVLFT